MNKLIKHENTFLTFYNYKEPLKKVSNGFGYQGVLLGTVDGEKIQCHICGKLFISVQAHANQTHNIQAKDYKEKFGLSFKTSLVSESERHRRKMRTIKWLSNLTSDERIKYLDKCRSKLGEARKMRGNKQPLLQLETKNKRGTCPDQLLQKIKNCSKKLNRTPSKQDFIDYCESQRYVHLIYKTFGSWTKALILAKLKPVQRLQKGGGGSKYSDEELLEYLQIFYQENQTPPTETDCRRGLVPDSYHYRKRFGSFPRARELAGIHEEVGRWN